MNPTATSTPRPEPVVAVVIPCYRVRRHVLEVIDRIGPECHQIYVVDDQCPEQSGDLVRDRCRDERVRVIRNPANLGVGGAVMAGYRAAISGGVDVIVKIDGDGQMPPELIPQFIGPIISGFADYTKGNRFFDLTNIRRMPPLRRIGNAALSFMSKFSSGYWDIFDPTNGFTAIHARTAAHLPLDKISRRYFFESDMLFRLNITRAVVLDVPMDSEYGDEKSNLRISKVTGEFLWKHARNFGKRIFYNYFLRDLSAASLELIFGLGLLAFGITVGSASWARSAAAEIPTPAGTVMLAALPMLMGLQLLLAFLSYDSQTVPKLPVYPRLAEALPRPLQAKKASTA